MGGANLSLKDAERQTLFATFEFTLTDCYGLFIIFLFTKTLKNNYGNLKHKETIHQFSKYFMVAMTYIFPHLPNHNNVLISTPTFNLL